MARYVRTAVNVPSLTGVFVEGGFDAPSPLTFDYEVPPGLQGSITSGHLVLVPFGSRTVQAVVLEEVDTPAVSETRAVLQLVDPQPVLTKHQIQLAEWMGQQTLAPISAVIGLFLPPGLAQQADTLFTLRQGDAPILQGALEKRIVQALRARGPLRGRQIDRILPRWIGAEPPVPLSAAGSSCRCRCSHRRRYDPSSSARRRWPSHQRPPVGRPG